MPTPNNNECLHSPMHANMQLKKARQTSFSLTNRSVFRNGASCIAKRAVSGNETAHLDNSNDAFRNILTANRLAETTTTIAFNIKMLTAATGDRLRQSA